MLEVLDMGKYNFYVWGSIAAFVLVLLFDAVQLQLKNNALRKKLNAFIRRKNR